MLEFIRQLHHSISANLSVAETCLLAVLCLSAWLVHKKADWSPMAYTVFLILYITLLRRTPGYREPVLLPLRLYPHLGIWVGNLLNLLLYVPFGWAASLWEKYSPAVVLAGLCLSLFCEGMQYLTACGQADVNDIFFNTLGVALGVWLARRVGQRW